MLQNIRADVLISQDNSTADQDTFPLFLDTLSRYGYMTSQVAVIELPLPVVFGIIKLFTAGT